ncbi:hypothetical protein [Azospirillum sp. TSO22-1]|uniref:hypothetical protein n=1 Tax=Azospirillum sp. TSO22-1 TaxID=716789 RepID=UPI0018EEC516|nr:hypothetical protein [Azospirillum sp. TSO22-1]
MLKRTLLAAVAATVLSLPVCIGPSYAADVPEKGPPGGDYKKVSDLVSGLPDFIPGLGTLYVRPSALPTGPYLAYDRGQHLVGAVYMVPMKDMQDQKDFKRLASPHRPVDHVTVDFNPGHPGMAEPHYHFTVWYVSEKKVDQLAEAPGRK